MSQLSMTYSRRDWIVELLLLLAEGLLVWMVASLVISPFTSNPDPVDPLLAIGLVLIAGIVPRLLYEHGIWGASYSAVMAVVIALSSLVAVKVIAYQGLAWLDSGWLRDAVQSLVLEDSGADIVVWVPLGLSAVIWWLAHFRASPGLERCRATLRTGAAVSALVAIASVAAETGPSSGEISVAIGLFFASTLIALAIARQGSEATQSRRRLLTTVLLPTIAIVALALVLSSVATLDVLRSLPDSLDPLGTVLDPVFKILLIGLTGLVIVISLPLLWLLSLGDYQAPQLNRFSGSGQGNDPARSALEWHPPDAVRYLLASLFLVAIFYGVARFGIALTRRDRESGETGEREFGSGRGFGAWLDRIRWPFSRGSHDPLAALRRDPAWAYTVQVRETYTAWLRWAQEHKLGRESAETALELDRRAAPSLGSSAGMAALDELTAIYDDVRYSAVPATQEQADRAVRAWNQLRQAESSVTKR